MDRTKIEDILLSMRIPAGIKGFKYITDAVEYIEENGADISYTKELYSDIAEKNKTTVSRIERSIRYAFKVARSERGNREVVEKYIGFSNCQNSSSLVMLQKRIRQECAKAEDKTESTNNQRKETCGYLLEESIRKIMREELTRLLEDQSVSENCFP